MFIAMNRFKVKLGSQQEFEQIWKNRQTFLEDVPGFKQFHLLKGPETEEYCLYASHSVWGSRQAFEDWTQSEAFKKAHRQAGGNKDIYLGPPQLELFDTIL